MINESEYLEALSEINNDYYDDKKWLINNFELYKLTLNWPENLPPINRTNLIVGSLKEKFNLTYYSVLSKFEFEFCNDGKTLKIKQKE